MKIQNITNQQFAGKVTVPRCINKKHEFLDNEILEILKENKSLRFLARKK